jgi:pimeloyl-ACP methyl ester carboxylesterase
MHTDWSDRCERWDGVRSEHLEVDGIDVHVLRADGPADGRPQLLVHGLGGCAANWIEVISGLATHGPVVAPDLPGFGETEPAEPGQAGVPHNAAFLERLLDALGWQRATIHGNSMGGALAVHLAGLAPERVQGLVLTAPALPTPARALHRVHPRTIAGFAPFALPLFGTLAVKALTRLPIQRAWDHASRFVHAHPDRVPDEAIEVGFEDLERGRDEPWRVPAFVAAARSVVQPMLRPRALMRLVDRAPAAVLVVWGDADRLVGRSVIEHVAERRPDWEVEVLRGVGHVPMLEAPGEFVEVVARWLDNDRAGSLAAPAAA